MAMLINKIALRKTHQFNHKQEVFILLCVSSTTYNFIHTCVDRSFISGLEKLKRKKNELHFYLIFDIYLSKCNYY